MPRPPCGTVPALEGRRRDVSQSPACLRPVIVRCVDLLAGGLPYPSFIIAGNKLGATYERDLFAWAIELGGTVQPRALMLENVRGLSLLRFAAYRQHVRDLLWDPPGRLLECPESVIRASRPIRNVRTLSPAALMLIWRPGYVRKRVSEDQGLPIAHANGIALTRAFAMGDA